MKIAFTRFPFESEFGGIERVTIDLLKGLVSKGIDVHFWTNCPVFLDEKNKVEGIDYKYVNFPDPPVSKLSILKFIFFILPNLLYCRKLALKMKEAGVTHVCMLSFGEKLILTPFLLKQSIYSYWIEHERIRRWLTSNPFFGRYKRLSKNVKVVAVSEVFKEDLAKIGVGSVVVNNGVDTEFWISRMSDASQAPAIRQEGDIKLLTVARLRPEKGVFELLEALISMDGYRLRIVGDGPERERLEGFVQENNLNVEFLGALDPEDVRNVYEKADLAVFSSIERETSGLTALEAMSMEVPIVVSNEFGSMRDVDLKGVWKYENDLKGALVFVMGEIKKLNKEDLKGLRNYVVWNVSLEKMTQDYLDLFND